MKDQNTTQIDAGYWSQSMQPTTNYANRLIVTKVVGVTFEGRQATVAQLEEMEELFLRREPDNPYDFNAIRVERLDGAQIGYINRFMAEDLAPIFDAYGEPVPAWVSELQGGGYRRGYSIGVTIEFVTPEV